MKYALLDLPTRVDAAVASAARAEAAGLDRYMVAQVERADPIAVLAVVADRVPRIELATGVIAIQSTLPQHLAQQARTVNQISGGRFTLGIGVCHQPVVTEAYGLEWDRPYSHMVQYLDALLPLLDGQAVDVSGDLVSHRTEIEVPGPAPGSCWRPWVRGCWPWPGPAPTARCWPGPGPAPSPSMSARPSATGSCRPRCGCA